MEDVGKVGSGEGPFGTFDLLSPGWRQTAAFFLQTLGWSVRVGRRGEESDGTTENVMQAMQAFARFSVRGSFVKGEGKGRRKRFSSRP